MTTHFPNSRDESLTAMAASIARHPSAQLYDAVYDLAFPCVAVLAERKNVPLPAEHHEPVLRHALYRVSRTKLRQALQGNYDAVLSRLNRSLDVLATAQMITAFRAVQGKDMLDGVTLVARAEALVEQSIRSLSTANDRELRITIWPDLAAMSAEYAKRMSRAAAPPVRLSLGGVAPRVCVSTAAELWGPFVRTIMPALESPHD
jgi:hypothetical protein